MRPKKKVKQSDIAKKLGISIVTVSNALTGKKGVGEELRKKILETAFVMGYQPPGMEKKGSLPARKVIFMGEAQKEAALAQELGIEYACGAYEDVLAQCGESEFEEDKRVLGIIATERISRKEWAALEKKTRRPIVGMGFFESRIAMDYVMDDTFHGAWKLVDYLYDEGCEDIYFVRAKKEVEAGTEMERRFNDWLLGFRCGQYLHRMKDEGNVEQAEAFDLEESTGILEPERAAKYLQKAAGKRGGRTGFFCMDEEAVAALEKTAFALGEMERAQILIAGYEAEVQKEPHAKHTVLYRPDEKRMLDLCVALLEDRTKAKKTIAEFHPVYGRIEKTF